MKRQVCPKNLSHYRGSSHQLVTKFVTTLEPAGVSLIDTYNVNVPGYTALSSFKLVLANSR